MNSSERTVVNTEARSHEQHDTSQLEVWEALLIGVGT